MLADEENGPSAAGIGIVNCFIFTATSSVSARAAAEDADAIRLVGLQQLLVHRNHIIHSSGKWILRRHPVQHAHHAHARQPCYRN